MIKITTENGNFKVRGTFDFGYMGVYKDDEISINQNISEVRDWDIVSENLNSNCSDEELANFLTDYYNNFEKNIQKNIKQINDNFLLNVFCNMEDCGNNFWEIEEITIKDKLPQISEDDDIETAVYEPYWDITSQLRDEFYDTPNNGSIEKSDVEAILRKNYPMLNWDKLISTIIPEYVGLDDGTVSFQCSDDFGCEIMCGAYDCLDETLTFTDWHNF